MPLGCRGSSLSGEGRAAGSLVEWLVDLVGVEGERAGEVAVDEDVASGGGDDRERVLVVVRGADGDAPFGAETNAAAADDAGVDPAARAERASSGPAFGCKGPHVGRSLPADPAVRSVMV